MVFPKVRVNERSLVLMIGGGLLAAIAVAVVLFLLLRSDEEEGGNGDLGSAAPGNAAASLEGGPDEILYLSGTSLVRRNLEDGSEQPAGTIESPSVYPAHGSRWIAYVTSKGGRGEDFSAEPVLHVFDPEADEDSKYGAGVAPVWNRSGTHVAFLRPVEPRNCQGESCSGETQIGVVEASTGEEALLLDPGTYTVLGWAGEWVLVSDFQDPDTVISVSLDGEQKELDMPASQYWDSSPDGRWVVKANAKKTEFVSVEDGELGDERVTVKLGDYQLLEGAWSHDSSTVAAVVTNESFTKKGKGDKERKVTEDPTSRIVLFSPDDPEPEEVSGTFGATGTVLWSVDNDAIVFANLLNPRKALFQAKYCPIGNESDCRVVTSWTEGVSLLRTE